MRWRIVSPRVGRPGDEFVPPAGVNVDALVAGGFVEVVAECVTPPISTPKVSKRHKETNQ